MAAKSDFGRAVANEFRVLKETVNSKPVNTSETGAPNGMDRSVKEQVISDIDRVIEYHEQRKPFPGSILSYTLNS
jgi:hypothetical protein